jgi:hypothetical protein
MSSSKTENEVSETELVTCPARDAESGLDTGKGPFVGARAGLADSPLPRIKISSWSFVSL